MNYLREHMRKNIGVAVVLLLVSMPVGAANAPALVIQGGSLFDPASGTMKPLQAIVIEGEKIKAVGTPERPAPIPKGAVR